MNRVFYAQGGTGVQAILDANDLGAGDVIVVRGSLAGDITVAAQDAGVLLYGGDDAVIDGSVTVQSGASNVTIQRLRVAGTVTVQGASGFTLSESTVQGGVSLQGGSGAQIVYSTITGTGLELVGAVSNARIEHNTLQGSSVGIQVVAAAGAPGVGATGTTIIGNTVRGTQAGLRLAVEATLAVRGNDIRGVDGIGIDIAAVQSGQIRDNHIHHSATGVRYGAAATLADNRIWSNTTGVAVLASATQGFGFAGGVVAPNDIFGNTTGVNLTGQMRHQTVRGNTVGVTGSGTLGGASLEVANRILDNTTGVSAFTGTIQFNEFGRNDRAVVATSEQRIHHNVFFRNTTAGVLVEGRNDVRIVNNTFYAPTGDNVRIQGGSSEVELRNNILWVESGYDIYVANDSQAGFFSDYNNLYATGNGKVGYWTKDFVDVLDWQADIAVFDLHSIGATVVNPDWARPAFVDRAHDDYRILAPVAQLRFTSPSVDAGDAGADLGVPAGYTNLITNAGFENGLTGWTTNNGAGVRSADPVAFEGANYFIAGNVEEGFAEQTVDLVAAGHTAAQLDAQDLELVFGGRLRSYAQSPVDRGEITITFLNAARATIGSITLQADNTIDRWQLLGGRADIPVGARFATLHFRADRDNGTANDAYLDQAFVYVRAESDGTDMGAHGFAPTDQGLA